MRTDSLSITAASDPWAELHALLEEPADELAFRAIAAALDAFPAGSREAAIARAAEALAGWPDEARAAPWSWLRAAAGGDLSTAGWRLARTLRTAGARMRSAISVDRLDPAPRWEEIRRLECDGYPGLTGDIDEENPACAPGSALTARADRWPALRHVGELSFFETEEMLLLLASPVLDGLESLAVSLPVRGDAPLAWPRALPSLRRLRLRLPPSRLGRALLDPDRLPGLTALEIGAQDALALHYDPAGREALEEVVLGAARLPRLEALELDGLPDEAVARLFERFDRPLARLALVNRDYFPVVAEQLHAIRLGARAIDAIVRSGAARALTRLEVKNNRLGAKALDLVAATAPGRLEHLSLVDVDLDDDLAERLAEMPQLAGVRSLDVSKNWLTARGAAALARSPHLGRLAALDVGGMRYDPYYSTYRHPQPIGDEGFAAIARAPWFARLESLTAIDAGIGPEGLRALEARRDPLRLASLDLTLNVLQADGATILSRAPAAAGFRRLTLDMCWLDDDAARAIAGAPMGALRALSLAYNSIGDQGVAALAEAKGLAGLHALDIGENLFGDEGLAALARSTRLTRLVELVTEQDVWNYRRKDGFGDEAARALASSSALARLDTLLGGVFDGYHGGQVSDPFAGEGARLVREASGLRPAARASVASVRREDGGCGAEDEGCEEEGCEDEGAEAPPTAEELAERDAHRREHDFRYATELLVMRRFEVPPGRLFDAFADPSRRARWWGPEGFAWRIVEVERPSLVVLEPSGPGERFRLTMAFDGDDRRARLTWSARFETAAECARAAGVVEPALEERMARLAEHVEGEAPLAEGS